MRFPQSAPFRPLVILAVGLGLGFGPAGCSSSSPPPAAPATSDHKHPETFAEGIAHLKQAAAGVASGLAAEAGDAADDAVHGAAHLLDDVKALLEKEKNLSTEARAACTKALDELFAAFEKVDEALHSEADDVRTAAREAHAAVREQIDAAITTLEKTFGQGAKP